jgi:hypothetical protein
LTVFSYDIHLRGEEHDLFDRLDKSHKIKAERAADDVIRDLKGHGYLKRAGESFLDTFERATVELTIVADENGATVPAGTPVGSLDPENGFSLVGDAVFVTDAQLVLAADGVGTVMATALFPGRPYNVEPQTLNYAHKTIAGVASITNVDAATGGVDHQFTRAATYATLAMVYMDFLRAEEDVFDHKRRIWLRMYKQEINRLVASGLDVDFDGDGQTSEAEALAGQHGFHRLDRG